MQVSAWECPDMSSKLDIESRWKISSQIFEGTIQQGAYTPDSEQHAQYLYVVVVGSTFKGDVVETAELVGDATARRLAIGENYVFFLQDEKTLNLCSLVLPFHRSWASREDIWEAEYVRKILALSEYET